MDKLKRFKKLLKEKNYQVLGNELFTYFVTRDIDDEQYIRVGEWYDELSEETKAKLE
jgi:hypothetical protein